MGGGVSGLSPGVALRPPTRQATEEKVVPKIAVDVPECIQFLDVPTPELLRQANKEYAALGLPPPLTDTGELLPYPCPSQKQDIFKPKLHLDLEQQCRQVPEDLYRQPLQQLVDYMKERAGSDVEKARAVYIWIISQDLHTLPPQGPSGSPSYWLHKVKQDDNLYNDLYCRMCRCIGLRCNIIKGKAKSSAYSTGEQISSCSDNTWVAVKIDDTWRLVDMLWGSSCVSDPNTGEWMLLDNDGQAGDMKRITGETPETFTRQDDFYFLTNPEQFIWRHYPHEPKWQLLARPVTKAEFEIMADIKESFFTFGLTLGEQRQCVMQSEGGEVAISLGLTKGVHLSFSYVLWVSAGGKKKLPKDFQVDRFAFMTQSTEEVKVIVSLPVIGKYKLQLKARRCGGSEKQQPLLRVVEYVIYCDQAKVDCVPLPENTRQEWGPGPSMRQAGVAAISHIQPEVYTENGEAEIRFKVDDDVMMQTALVADGLTDVDGCYVVHRREGDQIVVNLKAPREGKYALNILTKRQDEKTFINECTYLVICNQAAPDSTAFPAVVPEGQIGEHKQNQVKLTSHPTPIIETSEKELQLVFEMMQKADLNVKLYHDGEGDVSDMVMGTHGDGTYTSLVRLPYSGMYTLDVLSAGEDQKEECMYRCIIRAHQNHPNLKPFPKVFKSWHEGKLFSPTSGVVPSDDVVTFTLSASDVDDVCLTTEGGTDAQMRRGAYGTWTGQIKTGPPGSNITVKGRSTKEGVWKNMLQFKTQKKEAEVTGKDFKPRSRRPPTTKVRNIEKALTEAVAERNPQRIKKLFKEIVGFNLSGQLKDLVLEARAVLESVARIARLKQLVRQMDVTTISEIRRYRNPPAGVHDTMMAALLLLGNHEGETSEWQQCQALCPCVGRSSLSRRVMTYQVEETEPEIAARAKQLLSDWPVDDIRGKSDGAGVFHEWTSGMVAELESIKPETVDCVPANVFRQVQLLHGGGPRGYSGVRPASRAAPYSHSPNNLRPDTPNMAAYRPPSRSHCVHRPPSRADTNQRPLSRANSDKRTVTPSSRIDGNQRPSRINGNQRPLSRMDGNQRPSSRIESSQRPYSRIVGNQRPLFCIDSNQRPTSRIDGNQRPSSRIDGNQRPSSRIDDNQRPYSRINGNQRPLSRIGSSYRPLSRSMSVLEGKKEHMSIGGSATRPMSKIQPLSRVDVNKRPLSRAESIKQ